MSIKWSAVKVSGAMDEVECQVTLADDFIAQAKVKAEEARKIANLPQYMDTRLISLIGQLERMERVKLAIESVRNNIPQEALEEERRLASYGSQQSIL
ncbi:MAG TPA: hypothetical protein G4O12_08670 [Dehalococcoidia bacterium]|nr:hypothetical protein [Dehalococcoidia bacterium]